MTSGLLLSPNSENTQVGSQATHRLLTIYYYLVWYYCVGFISHEFAILPVKYLQTRLRLPSQMLHLAKKVYLWELGLLASDKLLAQDSQAS